MSCGRRKMIKYIILDGKAYAMSAHPISDSHVIVQIYYQFVACLLRK